MKKQKITVQVLTSVVIFAILAGAAAGAIASVVTNQSLERYAESLRDGNQFFRISEEKPRPLPGTYEEALERVREIGWLTMAGIRGSSSDSASHTQWEPVDSMEGYGTILTSDGWLLFSTSTIAQFADPESQAEIWIAGDRYEIQSIVGGDYADFTMVKVDASGLTTLAFGRSDLMEGGEILFALGGWREVESTNLRQAKKLKSGIVHAAEEYTTHWQIADDLMGPAPLLNSVGELVGYVNEDGVTATPMHQLLPFVQTTLRGGSPVYAGLGVRVTNVSEVLNISTQVRAGADTGAFVHSFAGTTTNVTNPALEAKFREGDIILGIDDVPLTKKETLAELLAFYSPQDTVVFQLLRDGEELDVRVTLADAGDLVY